VPVFDFAGSPLAAINVSGPVGTFAEDARRNVIGQELRAAGFEISRRLGWIGAEDVKQGAKRALVEIGE
jgi:DNA-binding IclR family transcriptional regulator